MRPRVIPTLLLKNNGLYKTKSFKNEVYIGDPINAVKIFNDKEVDELCFLDISAARNNKDPDFETLKNIASECFMPLSYGGGIKSSEMVRELTKIGIEKVIINSAAYTNKNLIKEISEKFGVSTVVGSIDVRRNLFGKESVYIHSGSENIPYKPEEWAVELQNKGVGEIIINSINKDGTMKGYDIDLIRRISKVVKVPVVASGGASSLEDFSQAIKVGASAVAAGSFFVFKGPHKAVLITYPDDKTLNELFKK